MSCVTWSVLTWRLYRIAATGDAASSNIVPPRPPRLPGPAITRFLATSGQLPTAASSAATSTVYTPAPQLVVLAEAKERGDCSSEHVKSHVSLVKERGRSTDIKPLLDHLSHGLLGVREKGALRGASRGITHSATLCNTLQHATMHGTSEAPASYANSKIEVSSRSRAEPWVGGREKLEEIIQVHVKMVQGAVVERLSDSDQKGEEGMCDVVDAFVQSTIDVHEDGDEPMGDLVKASVEIMIDSVVKTLSNAKGEQGIGDVVDAPVIIALSDKEREDSLEGMGDDMNASMEALIDEVVSTLSNEKGERGMSDVVNACVKSMIREVVSKVVAKEMLHMTDKPTIEDEFQNKDTLMLPAKQLASSIEETMVGERYDEQARELVRDTSIDAVVPGPAASSVVNKVSGQGRGGRGADEEGGRGEEGLGGQMPIGDRDNRCVQTHASRRTVQELHRVTQLAQATHPHDRQAMAIGANGHQGQGRSGGSGQKGAGGNALKVNACAPALIGAYAYLKLISSQLNHACFTCVLWDVARCGTVPRSPPLANSASFLRAVPFPLLPALYPPLCLCLTTHPPSLGTCLKRVGGW